jgi:hypothetical protein
MIYNITSKRKVQVIQLIHEILETKIEIIIYIEIRKFNQKLIYNFIESYMNFRNLIY